MQRISHDLSNWHGITKINNFKAFKSGSIINYIVNGKM